MTLYAVKPPCQRTLEPVSEFAIGHAISANHLAHGDPPAAFADELRQRVLELRASTNDHEEGSMN